MIYTDNFYKMKTINKFAQLVEIIEAAGAAPAGSLNTKVGTAANTAGGVGTAVRAVAGGVGNVLKQAITDPSALGARMKAAAEGGAEAAMKSMTDNMKSLYGEQFFKELEAYQLKLNFPVGLPKQGSAVTIESPEGPYSGVVSTMATGNRGTEQVITYTVEATSESDPIGLNKRVYTIMLYDIKNPYHVKTVAAEYTQDGQLTKLGDTGAVDNASTLVYDNPNRVFVVGAKKDTFFEAPFTAGLTVNQPYRGKNINDDLIEGTITKIITRNVTDTSGNPVRVNTVQVLGHYA